MELEEFISQTLSEIQKGVQSAIQETSKNDGAINPSFGGEDSLGDHLIQEVKFDIAVTAKEQSSVSAGGGIKVVGVNLGADGKETAESSHISRIQFQIPIIPPVQMLRKRPNRES